MDVLFSNRAGLFSAVLGTALFLSSPSVAFLIENKSEYPATVEIKDERFRTIEKVRIDGKGSYEFVDAARADDSFHIEAYVEDPADTLGIPTFLHEVKYKDKVCVPIDVCVNEKKKKKKGGFKIF